MRLKTIQGSIFAGLLCMVCIVRAATIRVAGGALHTDGHVAATHFMLDSDATLSGNGTISAQVAIAGTLSPGSGATDTGVLTFTGEVVFDNGRMHCHAAASDVLDRIEAGGNITGTATIIMTRAETAFPTQRVVAVGGAASDYSLFAVVAASNWISGASGSLDLWVSYAPAPEIGPVTVWRATNQVLKVSDLLLLTNAVDPSGSAMAVVWVSPASTNGGTLSLSGHWTTYTPPVGDDTPDQFSFLVRNALSNQSEGTATILVFTPETEGQTMNISSVIPSATNTLVRFVGIPGRGYEVQSTTNILETPWRKAGDIVIGPLGYTVFTDTNEPSSQFYRTVRPE